MGWAWRSKGGSILSHNWKVMLDANFLEGSGRVNSLRAKWRKERDSRRGSVVLKQAQGQGHGQPEFPWPL